MSTFYTTTYKYKYKYRYRFTRSTARSTTHGDGGRSSWASMNIVAVQDNRGGLFESLDCLPSFRDAYGGHRLRHKSVRGTYSVPRTMWELVNDLRHGPNSIAGWDLT